MNLAGIKSSADTGELSLNKCAKTLREVAKIDIFADDKQTQIKDMAVIMEELAVKWDSFNDPQKAGIAEAIAGKNQAAVFQSLMQNFDVVRQVQEELSSGMHFESMEKENAQYIDSIAGKLNTLKETWVGVFNTIFSSDATKNILDGLIAISEAIANVITMLDETGMLTPVLVGLGTLLASKAFTGLSSIFSGGERSARGLASVLPGLTRGFTSMSPPATQLGSTLVGMGTNIAIAGTSIGGFLTTAASFIPWAIGGAVALGGLIWAVDHFTESLDEEKDRLNETISARKQEISSIEDQKGKLQGLQKEYDELANKPKKTAKEIERLNELTKQIAEIRPDLIVAYDENNNPILSMTGDVKDLIEEMNKATESKKRLLSVEQSDLAENSIKQLHGSNGGLLESEGYRPDTEMNKLEDITTQHIMKMNDLESKRDKLLNKLYSSTGKERQQILKDLEKANYDIEKQQSDFTSSYQQQLDVVKEYSDKIGEGIFSSLENSSIFNNMDSELQNVFSGLKESLDFTDIKTEDQLLEVEMALNSLMKAAANGDIDINNISKALEKANSEFAKTGDAEKYGKAIDDIISGLESATGKDFSMLKDVFEGMDTSILKGKDALDEFLRAYGKTKADLDKDDGFAKALSNQKRQIEQTIEELNSISGDAEIDLELAYNIVNNEELPQELRDMVRVLINKGNNSTEVVQFAQELLVDISDGSINIDEANEKIKSKFGEDSFEITPEILMSEGTKIAGIERVIEQLNERFGEVPAVVKTVIEAEGITAFNSAKWVMEAYNEIPEEVRTEMSNNGTETLADIININNMLGVLPEDIVMDIVTNFPEVVQSAGSVEEIIASLPNSKLLEIQSNYPEVVENSQLIQEAIDSIPATKESTVSVQEVQKNPGGLFDRLFGKNKSDLSATATVTTQVNNAKALTDVENKIKSLTSNGKAVTLKADASDVDQKTKSSQSKVDNIKQKSPTKIEVDNTSANNRLKTTKTHLDNIKSKSVTVTVNTSYTTTGSKPSGVSGISLQSEPEVRQAVIEESNKIALLSDSVQPYSSPVARDSSMAGVPELMSYKSPVDTVLKGYDYFIELENQLKKINSQLDILDTKMENAVGQEKINYLQQQVNLYKEQQNIQQSLINDMTKYQSSLKSYLSGKGFGFDSIGNVTNYHDKLMAMEKELERLEEAAKKASDNSSNYKGDNDSERDRLSNLSKQASEKASQYKENLDEIKKVMSEYMDITFTDLPNAKNEWEDLNNSIKDVNDTIEELNRNQKLFSHQNKVKELEYEYDKLADKLDILDTKLDNAYGADKLKIMDEQIKLLQEQQKIQQELINSYKKQADIYRSDLSNYGFNFDSNGDFTNLDETLNKFKNSKDLEKVTKLVEEYIDIQRDGIPDAISEWEKLGSEIKSIYKEQLNVTKDIQDKITEVYKKQVEERKKLIDEELDARLKALNKEKDAYNEARKEADYQRDYEDQLDVVSELEKKLAIASKDTSISGQKKVQELLEQLKEEQRKLEDLVQSNLDDQINSMFDKESDRLEEEAEAKKEELESKYSDSELQKIVDQVLSSGVFIDIDGNIKSLQDALVEFEDSFGDGMTVIGDLIKNEMIANLEIAKDTMKDLTNIMNNLNLEQYSAQLSRMSMPSVASVPTYQTSNTQTVQFNSPLIVVEGDITEDVLPQVRSMMDNLKDDIAKQIVNYIK